MLGRCRYWAVLWTTLCSVGPPLVVWAGPPNKAAAKPRGEATVSVALAVANGADGEAAVVLAGRAVDARVIAPPGREFQWQFGHGDTVVAHGSGSADAKGKATFAVAMPDVRVRTEFTLFVIESTMKARQKVMVIPSRMLARAAEGIKALRLGVIDDTGLVAKALAAEGVAFESLTTRLTRDAFNGGAVILAGFERARPLDTLCSTFEARAQAGMVMMIVNPPEGWRTLGLSCRRAGRPPAGAVSFSDDLGRCLQQADLGTGAKGLVLGIDRSCKILAWVESPGKGRARGRQEARTVIIAEKPVGKGRLIAAVVPRASDPLGDAVGRCVLDELILWALNSHTMARSNEEKQT